MLNQVGIKSSIFHPENPTFSCNWFEHNAPIRAGKRKLFRKKHEMYEDIPFEPESDFLVIPEVWANQIGSQCIERKLKYAIYVQNGYMIYEGGKKNLTLLKKVYEQAALILSISEDTSKVIRMTFPEIDGQKIIRLIPDVPNSFRVDNIQKKKIISYMPRKLEKHTQLVNFFLKNHLPPGWSITPIQNKSEAEVITALKESAIFLSFCESEGFALPPLEAALSGNLVIGYTGEGAKEYFHPPIFREVHNGNYINFITCTMEGIAQIEAGVTSTEAYKKQLTTLSERYSVANESALVVKFGNAVKSILNNTVTLSSQ
jgi:hypothetical protein